MVPLDSISADKAQGLIVEDLFLGAKYRPKNTRFGVWSPNAQQVNLVIYKDDTDNEQIANIYNMKKDNNGIWRIKLKGNHKNKLYHYQVEREGEFYYVVDPYAKAVSVNGVKGVIVDLEDTNPPAWEDDQRPPLNNLEDAIIYEMHIRDFSISEYSGIENQGKYLAFTEEDTTIPETGVKTGIDHLTDLGITHIHLLPIFDFGSVDETKDDQYNWGYDPLNYNIPEGSYATAPKNPLSRITEVKEMVQSLHQNGIRVVMDVVYNHTYNSLTSNFAKLAPEFYYRHHDNGGLSNGSGCGNEIASEQAMVRKFIIDSIKYWAEEYHIDGFRFDLMALHDQQTMQLIRKSLDEIDPTIIIYGEPWVADYSSLPMEKRMSKGLQQNLRVGVFNDNLRDAIKGSTRGEDRGYATGKLNKFDQVREGIIAGINSFVAKPHESINYVSAHDDLTLWDKIEKSNSSARLEDKIRMNNLCNAIILTSQGVPFLHGGVEFLRSKYGVANSYKSPDKINQLEWQKKLENHQSFAYYRGLIKLRKEHPAFRMTSAEQIREQLEFIDTYDGIIAYQLKDYANGDSWKKIVVIFNPNHDSKELALPEQGNWKVVVKKNNAGTETLEIIEGEKVLIPKISSMVLYL